MKYTYELNISPEKEEHLFDILYKKLSVRQSDFTSVEITRKSIDARKKPDIVLRYTILLEPVNAETEKKIQKRGAKAASGRISYVWPDKTAFHADGEMEEGCKDRPVIVGFGPAGIFAGLYLARAGMRPVIIERGAGMDERIRLVEEFHKGGKLNINTNVQFGEGGAGTFSDGKLNTGVKDKYGRNRAVLETFHEFGAPEDILYDGRAHIGTDVIRKVVVNIRKEIERLGGEVRFGVRFLRPEIKDDKLTGIWIKNSLQEDADGEELLPCTKMILAIGHSSRDTYETLHSLHIPMEAKAFAVGFRVIHRAEFINESQYGEGYKAKFPMLPAAYYKLAYSPENGRNVYSFCMCPGGYVVNASSEEERLAVNGMSNAARDGEYSNAAMVMNVSPKDFGSDDVLAGMYFQRRLEEEAYRLGDGKIPVQFYLDYEDKVLHDGEDYGKTIPEKTDNTSTIQTDGIASYKDDAIFGGCKETDLSVLFNDSMNRSFVEGMRHFDASMKGYASVNPLLCGIESRTSAPVRILRDESYQSLAAKGIYPCGEGAGYAGGITSAAIDGLKVAEVLAATGLND